MKESRAKLILKYVLPTILSQCAFFLFTIVDGIFVGRGVGTDALGAVNLAQPLVMVIGAVFMWKWSAIIFSGIPPLRSPPPLPPPCRASAGTTARRCSSWFPPSSAPL